MNPENYAISNYSFGFTEAARFGNSYLMADDTGLYVLGGDTDNGTSIVSVLTTAGMDLDPLDLSRSLQYLGQMELILSCRCQ